MLGRVIHNSVDFLASEKEIDAVGQTLRDIVGKIDFGRDLEQQLKILSEARGIFINFDQVTDLLVSNMLTITLDYKSFTMLRILFKDNEAQTHQKKLRIC